MSDTDARPQRICDVCYAVDDHPRHLILTTRGAVPVDEALIEAVLALPDLSHQERAALIADAVDTTLQLRHHDCCLAAGCPDGPGGACARVLGDAGGKTGPALLKHIQATQKAAT